MRNLSIWSQLALATAGVGLGLLISNFSEHSPEAVLSKRFITLRDTLINLGSYPKIDIGDKFPVEFLKTTTGSPIGYSRKQQQISLFIFMSPDCFDCEVLQTDIEHLAQTTSGTRELFLIYDTSQTGIAVDEEETRITILYTSLNFFRDEFNLRYLPTMFAVNHMGVVKHIQFGYEGTFDEEITSITQ